MADTRPRIARFTTPAALRGAAPPPVPSPAVEHLGGPAGRPRGAAPMPMPTVREDEDVVDVEYILENKPKVSVVRDFFRVQARALTACLAGEDDYL